MRVGDVAVPVGLYRPQFLFHQASDQKSQALTVDGPRSDRPIGVLDLPKFPPSARVITIRRFGPSAEHLCFPGGVHDERCAMGLPQIAILRHLARHTLIVPYY